MSVAVYAQRNSTAQAYDSATVALLESDGWTVNVESGGLGSADWSGVDLLVIGSPGGSTMSAHPDAQDMAGYGVDILCMCAETYVIVVGTGFPSGVADTSYGDGESVQHFFIESHGSVSAQGVDPGGPEFYDGLDYWNSFPYHFTLRFDDGGLERAFFGFSGFDQATKSEVDALFLAYAQESASDDADAWAELPEVIGTISADLGVVNNAYADLSEVIGQIRLVAAEPIGAWFSSQSVIGGMLATAAVPAVAYFTAGAAIGGFSAVGRNDWTVLIDSLTTQLFYSLELDDGELIPVRLPMTSWQATLQLDRSSYVQAVVPNAGEHIAAIIARDGGTIRILRGARFEDGNTQEVQVASAPLQRPRSDEGPTNHTMTLSGYAQLTPPEGASDRVLQDIRTISTDNGIRTRCGLDWWLRPGQMANARGASFKVAYINYYVTTQDEYMDVGERPL